jgi:predicted membrane-bound mannosyltransferase
MRVALVAMTALAIAGCSKTSTTTTTSETTNNVAVENVTTESNMAAANMTNASAAALTTINETSWEYKHDGKDMQESIDANGKYITQAGKEHIDHGTAVMKDGKACFTSLMDKKGEVCWTDPKIAVGGSGVTVSDKSEKLPIKRVAYTPLKM